MTLLRRVIGAVLRRARQAQGRTLREVADEAGVSLPYLSEVERGTKEASSEVLAAICRALGMPLPDLLDEARKELLRGLPAPRGRQVSGQQIRAGSSLITHRATTRRGPQCMAGGGLRSAGRLRSFSVYAGSTRF